MSGESLVRRFPEIEEPLLIERSAEGRNTHLCPAPFAGFPPDNLPLNETLPVLPDLSETECVRHFTRLSRLNYGVDQGMYPLGSCTMKYNPKIAEEIARTFAPIHPADPRAMPAVLACLWQLKTCLQSLCGLPEGTLWPAAGAHGELTGMLIIRKALDARSEPRSTVLIPDTAHGTNPASCTIAGFETRNIPSGPDGTLEAATVAEHLDADTAALMITNPNTLGIFERDIARIADLLHENGSYLYMDGANMNALVGVARPGDMGVDCLHLNLHKTFGTPHGGGGPGSGPVLVTSQLASYLPVPLLVEDEPGSCVLKWDAPQGIGMVHTCLGNTTVLLKALVNILSLGPIGLRQGATMACLNANYLKRCLEKDFDLPYAAETLHEFVLSDRRLKTHDLTTMDVAKALMDYGFHPPTVYFPLVVPGALMIEPTETESREELDRFVDAMRGIAAAAESAPESLHAAPQSTPVERVDEVRAARNLVLTWRMHESPGKSRVSK